VGRFPLIIYCSRGTPVDVLNENPFSQPTLSLSKTFTWKLRPESGPDCLICAMSARPPRLTAVERTCHMQYSQDRIWAVTFRQKSVTYFQVCLLRSEAAHQSSQRCCYLIAEQWLQRHPEAGSSWPSWPKASYCFVKDAGPPQKVSVVESKLNNKLSRAQSQSFVCIWVLRAPKEARYEASNVDSLQPRRYIHLGALTAQIPIVRYP